MTLKKALGALKFHQDWYLDDIFYVDKWQPSDVLHQCVECDIVCCWLCKKPLAITTAALMATTSMRTLNDKY
jgi:hypothetical protein